MQNLLTDLTESFLTHAALGTRIFWNELCHLPRTQSPDMPTIRHDAHLFNFCTVGTTLFCSPAIKIKFVNTLVGS